MRKIFLSSMGLTITEAPKKGKIRLHPLPAVHKDSKSSLNFTLADLASWNIGGRPSYSYVDGIMDEVRVSNVARSASEIAANY